MHLNVLSSFSIVSLETHLQALGPLANSQQSSLERKLLSSLCNKRFTGPGAACPFECGGVLPITIHYGSITPATLSVLLSNSLACLALLVGGNRSVSLSTKNSGNRCSHPHHYHWFFLIPKLGFTPIFLKCHLVIFSPACPSHFETFFFFWSLITLDILYSVVCATKVTGTSHAFFKLAGKVTIQSRA